MPAWTHRLAGLLGQLISLELTLPDIAVRFLLGHESDAQEKLEAIGSKQAASDIGNAVQHGDKNLPITVRVEGAATGVSASVHNRGVVIPPAEMLRIFDPLVRGAGSTTPHEHRPGSIGLGLYIARELVLAHGGTIDVTSTAVDGTEFTFHLPRHARRSRPSARC